jgi:hypothetical protein
MFGDPMIIAGAGILLAVILIAAGIRLYNKLKAKVINDAANKPTT